MTTRRAMLGLVLSLAVTDSSKAEAEPAKAKKDVAKRFRGSYRYVGGERERKRRDQAIDDVVEDMNILVRAIARSRLKAANPIIERVVVSPRKKELTIVLDGRRYTAPLDGSPVRVTGIIGDEVEMRYRISQDRIRQHFEGEDGGRVNSLAMIGKGIMRIYVRVFSDQLPKDLSYALTYEHN